MCLQCVKEALPDRKSVCLDNGSYLLNWKGCGQCGSVDFPVIAERKVDKDEEEGADEEEETTYLHKCSACDHEICQHYHKYTYQPTEQRQEYFMECVLCGKGVDSKALEEFTQESAAAITTSATEQQGSSRSLDLEENVAPAEVVTGFLGAVERLSLPRETPMSNDDDNDDEWED